MDVAERAREFVRVAGPDAADYLQRMVSNDVEALAPGEACPALLLTAKARVIAPVVVLRRADDDFLLLTEPGLGDVVRTQLTRMRLRAQCEIEAEEHESVLVFGGAEGFATGLARRRARRSTPGSSRRSRTRSSSCDGSRAECRAGNTRSTTGSSRRRRASTRRTSRSRRAAIRGRSRSRGCTSAAIRTARCASSSSTSCRERDAPLLHDGREVGRVTSAARREDGTVVALAYVRTEVPDDAPLALAARAG